MDIIDQNKGKNLKANVNNKIANKCQVRGIRTQTNKLVFISGSSVYI